MANYIQWDPAGFSTGEKMRFLLPSIYMLGIMLGIMKASWTKCSGRQRCRKAENLVRTTMDPTHNLP